MFLFADAGRDEELWRGMLYFSTQSSTPYNKNMFHDLSIIGEKLYVMRDGLIKYCRFCPKCVSIGQSRMWQSTPKTNREEKLEENWSSETLPGALSFPSAQHTDFK